MIDGFLLPPEIGRLAHRAYEAVVPRRIRVGLHNRWFAERSARWEKIRNKPEFLGTAVGPGVRMNLYGDSLLCEMLYFGNFELKTRSFFDAYLRPGDTFLDIGANVGIYTLAAARVVGPDGHAHAFEPCSQTFDRLQENVKLNGFRNVTCHRVALSHENSAAELILVKGGFDAWNSLGKPYMGEAFGSETVKTMTLDSFVQAHRLEGRNCVVKIDVEGWENQVLLGAQTFFSQADAPLLCVEFTEEAAQLAGTSCEALYGALQRLGYQIFTVGSSPAEIEAFPLSQPFPNVNLLATKDLAVIHQRLAPR